MADNDNSVIASIIRGSGAVDWLCMAESIVDSDPVIRTFASCEWDCLNEDGKVWVAAIVREAFARAAALTERLG